MILRFDRHAAELPPPSDPDPAGARVVQELLGGRFGEMSTLMNYTYQSFNFRGREQGQAVLRPDRQHRHRGVRPHRAGVGHHQLAAHRRQRDSGAADATGTPLGHGQDGTGNRHHFIATGLGSLCGNAVGNAWTGDYVFSSGNLILDLLHNFFLENGARTNKLRVYEMTKDPCAREMLGYLFVRGGVHALAYAKALEQLTGADLTKLFPAPRIPTDKIKECRPHIKKGLHLQLLPLLAERLSGAGSHLHRCSPRDGRGPRGGRRRPRGRAADGPAGSADRVRARLRARGDR